MDHVSDAFIDNLLPLLTICEPAQNGDRRGVDNVAPKFMNRAAIMQKVTTDCVTKSIHRITYTHASQQVLMFFCL